jgi:hypothetical protein
MRVLGRKRYLYKVHAARGNIRTYKRLHFAEYLLINSKLNKKGEKSFKSFPKGFSLAMSRVARWFVFKHEVPFWVNFGGPLIGKC